MSTTKTSTTAKRSTASIRASRPLMGWRTVDLLTVTFLGAAFGVAYWAWVRSTPSRATHSARSSHRSPPSSEHPAPGRGGRRPRRPPPGAALLCEVLAALVSMLPGTKWGFSTFVAGVLQGLGAELAFAILGYGAFGIAAAAFAGALSAPLEAVYEWFTYWADWTWGWKIAYLLILTAAGAVIAGVGGWLLTRALASAGALNAFLRARRPGSTALSEVATVLRGSARGGSRSPG